MKNLTLKILALVMTIILLLPLVVACGEEDPTTPTTPSTNPPEQTEAEKFDAMSEADKAFYILNMDVDNTDAKKFSNSVRLNLQNAEYNNCMLDTSISVQLVTVNTEEEYIDFNQIVISAKAQGNGYGGTVTSTSTTTVKTGWIDGKQFQYAQSVVDNRGTTKKTFTYQSKEDYLASKAEAEQEAAGGIDIPENFGVTRNSCATITCTQDEYGNWVAIFTDVNEEALAEFKKIAKPFEQYVNMDDITDVRLKLVVDSDLKPVQASVVYEFSSNKLLNLSLNCSYASGNDVVMPEIDISDYDENK